LRRSCDERQAQDLLDEFYVIPRKVDASSTRQRGVAVRAAAGRLASFAQSFSVVSSNSASHQWPPYPVPDICFIVRMVVGE